MLSVPVGNFESLTSKNKRQVFDRVRYKLQSLENQMIVVYSSTYQSNQKTLIDVFFSSSVEYDSFG